MKKFIIKSIAICSFCLFSCNAFSKVVSPFVNISTAYIHAKKQGYDVQNNKISPSVSYGISVKIPDSRFIASLQTNRALEFSTIRKFTHKKTGTSFDVKSRATADTFSFGYVVKNTIPTVFVSNISLQKKIENKSDINNALVAGAGLSILISERTAITAAIFNKNRELDLAYAATVGFIVSF